MKISAGRCRGKEGYMHRFFWLSGILLILCTGFAAAKNKVLIIKEDTPYKKALVAELIDAIEGGDTAVTVVDHRKESIDDIDPADYDAVFITNSGAQAQVRPKVLAWLRSVSDRDENIIIHTTQINEWTPPVEVDSITSASKRRNIDSLVEDIVQRIRRFF